MCGPSRNILRQHTSTSLHLRTEKKKKIGKLLRGLADGETRNKANAESALFRRWNVMIFHSIAGAISAVTKEG